MACSLWLSGQSSGSSCHSPGFDDQQLPAYYFPLFGLVPLNLHLFTDEDEMKKQKKHHLWRQQTQKKAKSAKDKPS